jgi:N-acetylneuraminic acid mutarotase
MYTKEQQEEFLKQSNRSFKPDADSRDFQQTERLRKEYAQGQAKMRQWNAELVEYERMKAHYKSLGEEPPYKTLGAFRRAKRAGSKKNF